MAGYIALVHKDEGTSYGVSFPDVPGCISAGDTLEEALANAGAALAAHLALMREDGDAIDAPQLRGNQGGPRIHCRSRRRNCDGGAELIPAISPVPAKRAVPL
jgi:predicted RNase H-like HicB family nuclease